MVVCHHVVDSGWSMQNTSPSLDMKSHLEKQVSLTLCSWYFCRWYMSLILRKHKEEDNNLYFMDGEGERIKQKTIYF